MKTLKIRPVVLVISLFMVGAWGSAQAQPYTNSTNYAVGTAIPDNNASGVSSTVNFSSSEILLAKDVNVTLNVSGDYIGDLYAYLMFNSRPLVVLLNRLGRRLGSDLGYNDVGLNIKLDDEAANGDIHNYRITLSGNPNTPPPGGVLTGVWAPDGRNVDPAIVEDTDVRTASPLNAFDDVNPNGSWTLFIADVSPGGTAVLESWGLQITGLVPEPATWALLALGGGALLVLSRRRKRR